MTRFHDRRVHSNYQKSVAAWRAMQLLERAEGTRLRNWARVLLAQQAKRALREAHALRARLLADATTARRRRPASRVDGV